MLVFLLFILAVTVNQLSLGPWKEAQEALSSSNQAAPWGNFCKKWIKSSDIYCHTGLMDGALPQIRYAKTKCSLEVNFFLRNLPLYFLHRSFELISSASSESSSTLWAQNIPGYLLKFFVINLFWTPWVCLLESKPTDNVFSSRVAPEISWYTWTKYRCTHLWPFRHFLASRTQ